MQENIKKILNELYLIDETLKDKEGELIKIISAMLNLRPNVNINDDFKKELKNQILQKITSEKLKKYNSKPNIWKILTYTFWTVWVCVLWVFIINENFSNSLLPSKQISFESSIKSSSNSFWSLAKLWTNENAKWWSNEVKTFSSKRASSEANDIVASPIANKMMVSPDMVDPNYIPEVYKYSFSWELNIDLKENMPVYKKEYLKSDSSKIAQIIWNIDFNWVNIWNFDKLWVSNISLNQEKDFWYNINIDFENNALNIYKNWSKWPQIDYSKKQTQVILQENEVISIAKNFLTDYKIDLSKYGEARIEKSYLQIMTKYASDRIMPEYPNNITNVIFPKIVDNNEVYEEYGQASWVRMEIDLENKKVISLNGLSVDNYLKSEYKVETSKENILKIASVWWRYGFNNTDLKNLKYVDITLINPKLKYINTYKYDNNKTEEYLVPAIVFEVVKDEKSTYYGETVTVPLVKDFYKYENDKIIWGNY